MKGKAPAPGYFRNSAPPVPPPTNLPPPPHLPPPPPPPGYMHHGPPMDGFGPYGPIPPHHPPAPRQFFQSHPSMPGPHPSMPGGHPMYPHPPYPMPLYPPPPHHFDHNGYPIMFNYPYPPHGIPIGPPFDNRPPGPRGPRTPPSPMAVDRAGPSNRERPAASPPPPPPPARNVAPERAARPENREHRRSRRSRSARRDNAPPQEAEEEAARPKKGTLEYGHEAEEILGDEFRRTIQNRKHHKAILRQCAAVGKAHQLDHAELRQFVMLGIQFYQNPENVDRDFMIELYPRPELPNLALYGTEVREYQRTPSPAVPVSPVRPPTPPPPLPHQGKRRRLKGYPVTLEERRTEFLFQLLDFLTGQGRDFGNLKNKLPRTYDKKKKKLTPWGYELKHLNLNRHTYGTDAVVELEGVDTPRITKTGHVSIGPSTPPGGSQNETKRNNINYFFTVEMENVVAYRLINPEVDYNSDLSVSSDAVSSDEPGPSDEPRNNIENRPPSARQEEQAAERLSSEPPADSSSSSDLPESDQPSTSQRPDSDADLFAPSTLLIPAARSLENEATTSQSVQSDIPDNSEQDEENLLPIKAETADVADGNVAEPKEENSDSAEQEAFTSIKEETMEVDDIKKEIIDGEELGEVPAEEAPNGIREEGEIDDATEKSEMDCSDPQDLKKRAAELGLAHADGLALLENPAAIKMEPMEVDTGVAAPVPAVKVEGLVHSQSSSPPTSGESSDSSSSASEKQREKDRSNRSSRKGRSHGKREDESPGDRLVVANAARERLNRKRKEREQKENGDRHESPSKRGPSRDRSLRHSSEDRASRQGNNRRHDDRRDRHSRGRTRSRSPIERRSRVRRSRSRSSPRRRSPGYIPPITTITPQCPPRGRRFRSFAMARGGRRQVPSYGKNSSYENNRPDRINPAHR